MTAGGWFAVLPDGAAAEAAARRLRPLAPTVIEHASGRPWLLGSRLDDQATIATAGSARVAVIGRCPVTAAALTARLSQVRDSVDLEAAARSLHGSYHLVASIDGRVWVRGSAAGTRLVFHTRLDGVTVAADRADLLAPMDLDEGLLALRLLAAPLPNPLDTTSLWRDVHGVPPDHGVLIEPDGRAGVRRWWSPPEPVRTRAEGVPEVRDALVAAVDSCTAAGGTISADLSGGLDSTSLCYLAAAGPARLVTVHWTGQDPGNDDTRWATRAAAGLPGTHRVLAADSTLWYADLAGAGTLAGGTDEPGLWIRDSARRTAAASEGARLHLVGGGGDELFTAPPQSLHDEVRRQPLAALGRVRRLRTVHRVPLRPLARGLVDRGGYQHWLAGSAARLDRASLAPSPEEYPLAWGPDPVLPPWATAEAVDAVAKLLRAAADGMPRPLSTERGQHAALGSVRATGRSIRLANQAYAAGPETAAPYLDDGVVDAALSVRVADRNAPGRFKPVLVDAMRGVVPNPLLDRTTKGDYSADLYHGLRRNRDAILDLCADSVLARAGLIDADVLRTELLGLHTGPGLMQFLDRTLGCELWVRRHSEISTGVAR